MWLLVAGIILLVVTTVWQSYCLIGGIAKPLLAPAIFYSSVVNILLQLSWNILFIVGIVMLFFVNWVVGIVAIPVYWPCSSSVDSATYEKVYAWFLG